MGQKATPAIRRGAVLVGLGVGGDDLVLADPVVEAEISSVVGGNGEADEEVVRLQLVDEVESAGERVLGALDEGSWVLVAPFGQQGRPPPSSQIDRRASDPTRSRSGAPACDQAVVEEPLEAVLAVPRSGKEEGLDLVAVQVAVRIQLLQNCQVTDGRFDVFL